MSPDFDIETGRQDVLADVTLGASLSDRLLESSLLQRELAAQIDVASMRSDRAAADQNPFDDSMRIVFELIAIGESTRLALVGIAAHVNRLVGILRNETPFG